MEKQNGLQKLWKRYIRGAKARNLDFTLSFKEFSKITSEPCYYCGTEPKQLSKSTIDIYYYNGVDRVNSNNGYFYENCVPCCAICNKMKGTLTHNEFLEQCKHIEEKRIKAYNESTLAYVEELAEEYYDMEKVDG